MSSVYFTTLDLPEKSILFVRIVLYQGFTSLRKMFCDGIRKPNFYHDGSMF